MADTTSQGQRALLYLALQNQPGLGAATLARLLDEYSTAEHLLLAAVNPSTSSSLPRRALEPLRAVSQQCEKNAFCEASKQQWRRCEQLGIQIIDREHAYYPERLAEIASAPPVLYLKGRAELLCAAQIAMVGSRQCTASGRETAAALARDFVLNGWRITSGMALGIDSVCHRAALDAGGETIAVLGAGLANIYPQRHRGLSEEILENGVLVSEFPPDTKPLPAYFPQRNRIISGLSQAVVLVEAAQRSGSLITARFALEQNRELFAVPGSIHNPLSTGCNTLIQQGAHMLLSAESVLQELTPLRAEQSSAVNTGPVHGLEEPAPDPMARSLACVLISVGFEPTSFDQIVLRSELSPPEVSSALLELQLLSRVEQRGPAFLRLK